MIKTDKNIAKCILSPINTPHAIFDFRDDNHSSTTRPKGSKFPITEIRLQIKKNNALVYSDCAFILGHQIPSYHLDLVRNYLHQKYLKGTGQIAIQPT